MPIRVDQASLDQEQGWVVFEGIKLGPKDPMFPRAESFGRSEARPPGARALALLADALTEGVAGKACPAHQASSLLGSNVDLVLALALALDKFPVGVHRHGSAASIVEAGAAPDILPFCPTSMDAKTEPAKFLAIKPLQSANRQYLRPIFRKSPVNSQYFGRFQYAVVIRKADGETLRGDRSVGGY